MKKFFLRILMWLPVIGKFVKAAYLASMVNGLVKQCRNNPMAMDVANQVGDELEKAVHEKAKEMFDEYLGPEIKKYDIPEWVVNKVKENALGKLVKVMREQIEKKIAAGLPPAAAAAPA